MKAILAAALVCAGFFSQSRADTQPSNPIFSGVYELQACEPECSKIRIESAFYSRSMSEVKGMTVSVVDQMKLAWQTCDGRKPYEFNIWLFGDQMRGSFMHNNLAASPEDYRKVCDGVFTTDARVAQLRSGQIQISLARESDKLFRLSWSDRRTGLSGLFHLKRVADRP